MSPDNVHALLQNFPGFIDLAAQLEQHWPEPLHLPVEVFIGIRKHCFKKFHGADPLVPLKLLGKVVVEDYLDGIYLHDIYNSTQGVHFEERKAETIYYLLVGSGNLLVVLEQEMLKSNYFGQFWDWPLGGAVEVVPDARFPEVYLKLPPHDHHDVLPFR